MGSAAKPKSVSSVAPLRESVELESITTPFNSVAARKIGERVDLEVEGATFATWHPKLVMTGYSWDALAVAALLRGDGPPTSILTLGLGGGTVTRQLRMLLPDVRLVGVEIDGAIKEGHAIGCADFAGLGYDQVALGWRTPNGAKKVGINLYVPPAKRRWGYWVMPFLDGDRLVGRVDLVRDHPRGELIVNQTWWEPGCGGRTHRRALDESLGELSGFIGAPTNPGLEGNDETTPGRDLRR